LALPLTIFCSGIFFAASCQPQTPKTSFTQADIDKIRWIEGKWRGVGADAGKPFYELYEFAADGKLENTSYGPDNTFTKIESSGSVYLENGEIIHKGGDWIWTASKISDSSIEFVPKEKATNSFVWKKENADTWVAVLANKNAEGKIVETVYRMERIKK
jgi:hypothetical protein